jgi:adenosylcobinamide-GDP ribazoletransferase
MPTLQFVISDKPLAPMETFQDQIMNTFKSLLAAWTFYLCLPAPQKMELDFSRIARWAPIMGLILGGILCLCDYGLGLIEMPLLVRSTIIILLWLLLTGGLHLDGAMDSADGLAVTDPTRRLAAVAILSLKIVSLSAITQQRWLVLLLIPGWARWAQVLAISIYPYLKAEGKGAMHSKGVEPVPDLFGGLLALSLVAAAQFYWQPVVLIPAVAGVGLILSYLVGKYFDRAFGGHTGDTYGAVVEWVEAIGLAILTLPLWYR